MGQSESSMLLLPGIAVIVEFRAMIHVQVLATDVAQSIISQDCGHSKTVTKMHIMYKIYGQD